GHTTIPASRTSWRTLMYAMDDLAGYRVGAERACGKTADQPAIACTHWYRSTMNAGNRLDAAATALIGLYDPVKGQWRSIGWWKSANALTALIDYSEASGSKTYRYGISNTFDKNSQANFTNAYMDDTGWWGLGWVRAYDLTKDKRYLDMAQRDAD